jgi:crotonobetainyl-CoA:carnitine CoA-transferase CaiB-like acyl-CoA transferase
LLADLGADVIKVENPKTGGDDTRSWGPPYVPELGDDKDLSAYFVCANRNKRSLAVDLTTVEGRHVIRKLAATSDILVENFKPGAMAKYELDYITLSKLAPRLIYCSISGFGQTGPNAHKPGYDLMAQAYGGIMSLTGEPEGQPIKVAVGIADVMCGMYATTGILAALNDVHRTGQGQHIDLALVDTQIAWLINEGTNFLTSGSLPKRCGNGHPNIVPYQVFELSDGHAVIAVGNDSQFQRFADWLGFPEWAADERFATNPARVEHRDALILLISNVLRAVEVDQLIVGLGDIGVPVGPVNTLDRVFGSDQVAAREMKVSLSSRHAKSGDIQVIGNPLKFSRTPVTYRSSPPKFGEHTEEILKEIE